MCQINLNQTNLLAVQQLELNDQLVDTINAEELHQFLEIETRFNDWMDRRINALGLVEREDYVTFTQKRALGLGRPLRAFSLTLEAAKHISMAERNQKGREAREYFISVESKAKTLVPQLQQQNKQLLDMVLNQNPLYSKVVRYSQLGLNASEIAKLCDITTVTLLTHRKTLADLNLIDPPIKNSFPTKKQFTQQQLTSIYQRHQSGYSLKALGREYGCSAATIKNRINALEANRMFASEEA